AHADGIDGAVAVALAANWVVRRQETDATPEAMIPWIVSWMQPGNMRRQLEIAAETSLDDWAFDVANQLGCGDQITAVDTVPFCLWMVASQLDDFCEALFTAARVGGDIDTNCAIIGGLVALNVGDSGIPIQWKTSREPLFWMQQRTRKSSVIHALHVPPTELNQSRRTSFGSCNVLAQSQQRRRDDDPIDTLRTVVTAAALRFSSGPGDSPGLSCRTHRSSLPATGVAGVCTTAACATAARPVRVVRRKWSIDKIC
ncbi:MAG: ADP-ribosylglycohydrolase family protein, partial [Planctomycetaceae bacterium]|nr:ADP-ribosylglycohydrolase family protein [Planctomycetaceae bacterium]